MSNPLYSLMNKGNNTNPMIQQFMQFRNSFKGDAQAQVQQLLNSGRVSQADYNKAVETAKQIQQMLRY